MSDFVSNFWSLFIIVLSVGGIVWCVWLLYSQRRWLGGKRGGPVEDTGHVWDGDLTELNNPVPRWWTWMYLLFCVFGLAYLVAMPGLGAYPGMLGFTSAREVARDQAAQAEAVKPVYARYASMTPPQIAADPQAREIGQRLFLNTCSQCHGSDAKGAPSYPNLTDNDWLGEGTPEYIVKTIQEGRQGVMPPWKAAIDPKNAAAAAAYVRSLSGLAADAAQVVFGKPTYDTYCVACHGADGKGNRALGSPNLADDIWLYSSSQKAIESAILDGHDNRMPAFNTVLTQDQIRVLGAWVWGLSNAGVK
jgi:cytochrome c oxidase cbb3-type subunit 3